MYHRLADGYLRKRMDSGDHHKIERYALGSRAQALHGVHSSSPPFAA